MNTFRRTKDSCEILDHLHEAQKYNKLRRVEKIDSHYSHHLSPKRRQPNTEWDTIPMGIREKSMHSVSPCTPESVHPTTRPAPVALGAPCELLQTLAPVPASFCIPSQLLEPSAPDGLPWVQASGTSLSWLPWPWGAPVAPGFHLTPVNPGSS